MTHLMTRELLAVCAACDRPRPLRPDGRTATHTLELAMLPGIRQRRPRRRCCPGSGQLPRRAER